MTETWQPAIPPIKTRWSSQVDPENPLPEYPRPHMVREEWLNLNGLWDYAIRSESIQEIQRFDGKILVPFAVESSLSGVGRALMPDERLWYRREFSVPSNWNNQKVLIHFGAVDWQ
ncbi:MAG: beta-galactosidase, partial [Gammaproteobacteria bacterium]|nr:beta-galactosidase [Gammaproteobacteria bacterium]